MVQFQEVEGVGESLILPECNMRLEQARSGASWQEKLTW